MKTILKQLKKIILMTALFSSLFCLNSQSKKTKFEILFESGTLTEIKQEFYKSKDLYKVRVNNDLDTILMTALKYDRGYDIINLILKSGCSISWQNRYNQDSLTYALKYSTNEKVIKLILKKSGNKSQISEKLLYKDKTQKFVWEYAQENPVSLKLITPYLPKNPAHSSVSETSNNSSEQESSKENSPNSPEPSQIPPQIQASEKPLIIEKTEAQKEENFIQNKQTIKTESEKKEIQQTEQISQENQIQTEPEKEQPDTLTKQNIPETKTEHLESKEVQTEVQQEIKKNPKNTQNQTKKTESNLKNEIKSISQENTKRINLPGIKNDEPVYLYDFLTEPVTEIKKESEDTTVFIPEANETDENGRTPLMNAAKSGNLWLLKSLIKSGADVKKRDNEGWTSMMYAIRYQNTLEVIDILAKNGALLNDKNNYLTSTLSMASMWSENPEILNRVLNSYFPGDKEIFKSFILCITSENTSIISQKEKLNVFLKKNVPVNRIYEGKTPLMYACLYAKSTEIIKLLLDSGAITTIRTQTNKTAFDFAAENKNLVHDETYWSLNTGR